MKWPGITLVFLTLTTAVSCAVLPKGSTGPVSPVLEIKDTASGRVYGRRQVTGGDEFAIEFVHSVHQSPVREVYQVNDGTIQAVSVRFFSFGAGMQSGLEEGQTISRDGDALVISGINRSFTELNYIVGTVSDHLLLINGETISLTGLCGKNAHITLRIK